MRASVSECHESVSSSMIHVMSVSLCDMGVHFDVIYVCFVLTVIAFSCSFIATMM